MKQLQIWILSALLSVSIAYANVNNANIEKVFKDRGYEAKVVSSKDSGIKGLSFVIAEQGGFWIPFLVNPEGTILIGITPDTIISDDKAFGDSLDAIFKQVKDHNQTATDEAVLKVFDKYAKNVITLEGKNTSKTTYLVLDTNCPYCKEEVKKLEERLKTSNLKILLVGALSLESTQKAATFYENINAKSTQKAKLEYITEAFSPSFKPNSNINTDQVMNMSMELGGAGLRGVPYIIER